jgi:hypothetical protein
MERTRWTGGSWGWSDGAHRASFMHHHGAPTEAGMRIEFDKGGHVATLTVETVTVYRRPRQRGLGRRSERVRPFRLRTAGTAGNGCRVGSRSCV